MIKTGRHVVHHERGFVRGTTKDESEEVREYFVLLESLVDLDSSQSTYKGTQKYRSDLQAFLQLDYDFIGNQECPHNIVSLIESYKSHQDVRIANSMILNGVCEPMKVDKQYRAEYGNITIDVARRAVELVQNVLSWSGDYEDGSWTAIMELVKRSLPNGVLSGFVF